MRRRHLLAALPTLTLAGCLSDLSGGRSPTTTVQTPPDGIDLLEFTHSEPARAGREARFGAVLRNSADAERTGTATLELSPTGEDWRHLVESEYDLRPGEQAIIETTARPYFIGSLQLRLVPFDRATSVDVTDQSLSYGATYELPNGVHLTVGEPRRIDTYEYEEDGQRRTATPRDGTYWDLVTVTAENRRDGTAIAPYRTAFETMGFEWREAIPYRADGAYEGGDLQAGASRTGEMLFETRHLLDEKAIRLRHPYENGVVGATWSAP